MSGWTLALSVLVAAAASAALQLPEALWAVMSALIVARPTARGTPLGAAFERIAGAGVGAAAALLALASGPPPIATVALVALLAFLSADVAWLRSAPITALIVVGSSAGAARGVAGLRLAEIGVGVAAGVLVARLVGWAGARAQAERFARDGADLLRRLGDSLQNQGDEREALRQALRRFTLWAEAADAAMNASRWAPRARLLARTVHDVGALERALALGPARGDAELAARVRSGAAGMLQAGAEALAAGTSTDLAPPRGVDLTPLRELGGRAVPWLAPGLALIEQDLTQLLAADRR